MSAGTELLLTVIEYLTDNQMDRIMKKMEIAELLKKGITYREISKRTGASSATIAKVAKIFRVYPDLPNKE